MTIKFSWEDVVAAIVGLIVLAIVVYALALMVYGAKVELACAQQGWRDYKVTWNFKPYCAREENEYEIIRPLADILEEAQGN